MGVVPSRGGVPILALVGKTNVGKSTLVNRVSERRHAFVSATPHTTRDRLRAPFLWRGQHAIITDSAGFNLATGHPLEVPTRASIERAIQDADVVGFVVDGAAGITEEDRTFARLLQKRNIPVIIIINKVDNARILRSLDDAIYRMGFSDIVDVSAANGRGVGDLLDMFLAHITRPVEPEKALRPTRVILVGQTNVGKSTLINMLLGSEEMITSPTPHTTRDAERHQLPGDVALELIDTAGLSRKRQGDIENLSQRESRRLLREADIACLVLGGDMPITVEDRRITMLIERARIGRCIVINKMDLIKNRGDREQEIRRHLAAFRTIPLMWVSAKTGKNVSKLPRFFADIAVQWSFTIPAEDLVRLNAELWASETWKKLKVERFEQVGTRPPRFRVRFRGRVVPAQAARERLANILRDRYGLTATPFIIDAARR